MKVRKRKKVTENRRIEKKGVLKINNGWKLETEKECLSFQNPPSIYYNIDVMIFDY